jgi:hypothetical protein
MAYAVKTTNRFILDGSSDQSGSEESDNETTVNIDPSVLIKKAEKNAIKATKQQLKAAEKMAQNEKTNVLQASDADNTTPADQKRRGPRNDRNREPKGNQAPRYGKRFEKERQSDIENIDNKNNAPVPQNEGRRETRQSTKTDRRSGNPRTGVRATEKRAGGGRGNWGKPTEVIEEPVEEALTPEENQEPVENAEQEETEPVEPEPVEFTLEEYRKQAAGNDQTKKGDSRKPNDGADLSGTVLARKEIYKNQPATHYYTQPDRNQNKNIISNDKLAFISNGGRGYRYFDNRQDRRGGRGRGEQQGDAKRNFTLETTAFPSLGGDRK